MRSILQHPVQTSFNDVYNGLSGTAETKSIDLNVGDVRDFVGKVTQSTSLDDWTPYANSAVYSYARAASAVAPGVAPSTDVQESFSHMALAIYIEAYLKAYFRNGQFVSGTVSLSSLETSVPALKNLQEAYKSQLQTILNSLQSDLTFGKIASTGFVTRGGDTLQFPAVNISFDVAKAELSASKIDYLTIGTDLVRVLFEAVFDSQDRIPAVSNATGVTVAATRTGAASIQLPDFQKITAGTNYVKPTADQFASIDTFANGVDAASGTATGEVIRSIGPAALNNEAVAKLIEAAMGATVHKVAEKLGWCWYATAPLPTPGAEAPALAAMSSAVAPAVAAAIIPASSNAAPLGEVRQVTVTVSYGLF